MTDNTRSELAELARCLRAYATENTDHQGGFDLAVDLCSRAADALESSPPVDTGRVTVTDEMVEAGAKTIPATGVDWATLHGEYKQSCRDTARRILTAALEASPVDTGRVSGPLSDDANVRRQILYREEGGAAWLTHSAALAAMAAYGTRISTSARDEALEVTDERVKRALQAFDCGTGDPNDYQRRMRLALEAALSSPHPIEG